MNLKQSSHISIIIHVLFTCALQQVGNIQKIKKLSTLYSKLNMDESLKLQKWLISSFVLWLTGSWVISLRGCCCFKSCRCWTCINMILRWNWYRLQHVAVFVHALRAQCNGWQDRKIHFYWHTVWQHPIWPQFTVILLKLLVTGTVSSLV